MARPQQGDLKSQLANKTGAAPPPAAQGNAQPASPAKKPKTLGEQITTMIPQLQRALPNNSALTADRLARLALTAIRQMPALARCDPMSFLGALMIFATLGLEPNTPVGHGWMIPYGREVTPIIGYKGMLELARRSGELKGSPVARLVYENDLFDLEYGFEEDVFRHVPWYLRQDEMQTDSGALRGGYLIARYKAGGADIHYTPIAIIHKHRARSKASEKGPWVTDYEAMCLKTVVRANWHFLPVSIEARNKVSEVDGNVTKMAPNMMDIDVIDVEYSKPEEGGVAEGKAQEEDASANVTQQDHVNGAEV